MNQLNYSNSAAQASYGATSVGQPPSEIDTQINRAHSSLERLESQVQHLRGRLGKVMRGISEGGLKAAVPAPEEVLTEHGEAIRSAAKRSERMESDLQYILEALAL